VTTTDVLRVHPKRSLSITAVVTYFVLTTPLFAVLYWYTAASGNWGWLLAVHLALAIACLLTLWRQSRVFAAVTDERLIGNGIFSRVSWVPRADIRRVVLVRVYARDSSDSSVQFLALDGHGDSRFRLRGAYWHDSDLEALTAAIGRDVTRVPAPLSQAEFFAEYPGARYWFERAR
jgi:hypothetical protein